MRKDDLIRIRHMLDAAKEAISFIKDKKRSDLNTNRMLVLSLVKSIEIIKSFGGRTKASKWFYESMFAKKRLFFGLEH